MARRMPIVAGGGTAPGFLNTPFGIACDPHQNVFVVDHHNFRIQ